MKVNGRYIAQCTAVTHKQTGIGFRAFRKRLVYLYLAAKQTKCEFRIGVSHTVAEVAGPRDNGQPIPD